MKRYWLCYFHANRRLWRCLHGCGRFIINSYAIDRFISILLSLSPPRLHPHRHHSPHHLELPS